MQITSIVVEHGHWPSLTQELKGLCTTFILGPHSCEWWARAGGRWSRFELDGSVRCARGVYISVGEFKHMASPSARRQLVKAFGRFLG